MTIFQKMLIVPLLSIVIYASFIMYADSRYRQTSTAVEEIRDDYIPMLDIAADNISLYKEISQILKDAVLANEASWVNNTEDIYSQITYNFYQLKKNPHVIDSNSLTIALEYFNQYYTHTKSFAFDIINGNNDIGDNRGLSPNIQQYYNQTKDSFIQIRHNIYSQFKITIDTTNHDMKQLVFWGGIVSLVLIVGFTFVTIITSFTTRKNLWLLNRSMKSLATDGTDFSRRLKPNSRDELGTLIYWFNQLSKKLENEHKQLKTISNTDNLTQLRNRMSTDTNLAKVLVESKLNKRPLSVAIMDVDFFKKVNDNYGHQVGDGVLKAIAEILKRNTRPTDIIGRWGGEEFIIIFVNVNLEKAQQLTERLRLAIQSHEFNTAGNQTASFGLTQAVNNDTIDTLFKRIDENLYLAKEKGRNQIVSDEK